MAFNLRYYGALAIYIDQMPALQLDFTAQYTRLKDALDADIFAQSGADAALYRSVVESLLPPAQALKARIDTLNARYLAADEAGDTAEMTRLRQAGRPLIRKVLNAFRYCQKYLLGLMYERRIRPRRKPLPCASTSLTAWCATTRQRLLTNMLRRLITAWKATPFISRPR